MKNRKRKRLDKYDVHIQHNIGISQNPKMIRIAHGTSKKQPMDLPKSMQMLKDFIKHI